MVFDGKFNYDFYIFREADEAMFSVSHRPMISLKAQFSDVVLICRRRFYIIFFMIGQLPDGTQIFVHKWP